MDVLDTLFVNARNLQIWYLEKLLASLQSRQEDILFFYANGNSAIAVTEWLENDKVLKLSTFLFEWIYVLADIKTFYPIRLKSHNRFPERMMNQFAKLGGGGPRPVPL